MSKMIRFEDKLPEYGKKVILGWIQSGHIEDGSIYEGEVPGEWYHVLFDGECLCCEPTHWMPFEEIEMSR